VYEQATPDPKLSDDDLRPTKRTEADADGVPSTLLLAYLAGFTLLLAVYFFAIFCLARGLVGGVGFSFPVLVQCIASVVVMAGFIIWLAPLGEALELWYLHRRPERRLAKGLCPTCGQTRDATLDPTARCPECGADPELREPWQFGMSTLRRFAILCTISMVLGSAAGAWWIAADERLFRAECAAGRPYERHRAWPADFATLRFDGSTMWSTSVLESPHDPTWRPRPRGEAPRP
jgi:hypothetical protein